MARFRSLSPAGDLAFGRGVAAREASRGEGTKRISLWPPHPNPLLGRDGHLEDHADRGGEGVGKSPPTLGMHIRGSSPYSELTPKADPGHARSVVLEPSRNSRRLALADLLVKVSAKISGQADWMASISRRR